MRQIFRNYLARLQNIAGDKPLMLGEYGIDTFQEYNEEKQAEILAAMCGRCSTKGSCGTVVFSFTDDWFTGGFRIEDWAFGLTRRDRSPKPAFEALQQLFRKVPQVSGDKLPDGQRRHLLLQRREHRRSVPSKSLERTRYPEYEVIFVDDGSTDHTQEILKKFPWVRNIQQKNMGLSHARNVGLERRARRDHRLHRQRLRG